MKQYKRPVVEFIPLSNDVIVTSCGTQAVACSECYCGMVGPCDQYEQNVKCPGLSAICDFWG